MEEKKEIKLEHPIIMPQEDGSEKVYREVFVGRLKNKHLKHFPKNFIESGGQIPLRDIPKVVSAITDISIEVADEMDVEDSSKVLECLQNFFGNTQVKDGSM